MKLVFRASLFLSRALSNSSYFNLQTPFFSTMTCESHSFFIKTLKLKQKPNLIQRRCLSVHEYQAMMMLQKAEIPVPEFYVAHSPDEVRQYANDLGIKYMIMILLNWIFPIYFLFSEENWRSRCSTEGAGAGGWPREGLMGLWSSWWRKDLFLVHCFYSILVY